MTLIETMARAIDFAPEGTAESMARAAIAAAEAAGWRLVPVVCTDEMVAAFYASEGLSARAAWGAAIAAAPKADE